MKPATVAGLAIAGAGAVAAGVALYVHRRRAGETTPESSKTTEALEPAPRDDAEALARVITSEARGYSLDERIAIAWTVRNRARQRGVSIVRLVCTPTCGPCCKGRPFSSARVGTAEDLALAREVLTAAESDDPTRGAQAFFEPREQDRLIAANQRAVADGRPAPHPSYRRTAAEVRARWAADGQQLVAAVGAFEFWRAALSPVARNAGASRVRRQATVYGGKYSKDMGGAEIAAAIRSDIKEAVKRGELARAKYSTRLERFSGGQSITITYAGVPFDLFNRDFLKFDIETRGHQLYEGDRYSPQRLKQEEKLEAIASAYNYDGSDTQTDYFNVNFYLHVRADHDFERRQREIEKQRAAQELAAERAQQELAGDDEGSPLHRSMSRRQAMVRSRR